LKKEAKTFAICRARCRTGSAENAKVFWFFFPKKNRFFDGIA
jgi:hypothetical protein